MKHKNRGARRGSNTRRQYPEPNGPIDVDCLDTKQLPPSEKPVERVILSRSRARKTAKEKAPG